MLIISVLNLFFQIGGTGVISADNSWIKACELSFTFDEAPQIGKI
jgi:hypothetical protein